eukprot:g25075.t1
MAQPEEASVLDCIIPAHEKDYKTLGRTVGSIRQFCPEVKRIFVIANFWPFSHADLEDCGCRTGWLLQQLLKLYAPLLIDGLTDNVLVCDADVVWLKRVNFLLPSAACLCTFDTNNCPPIRSAVDLHRYDHFVPAMLPGVQKPRPGKETAVCHHMVFQTLGIRKDILKQLIAEVEASWERPFWKAFAEAARQLQGRASEYELYYAFAMHRCPSQVQTRALPFAVVADIEAMMSKSVPPVVFAVAHSHLEGLSAKELEDREGIINGDIEAENLLAS